MTLWQRTKGGIALCALVVGAMVLGNALILSGFPGLEQIGGVLRLLGDMIGYPMLIFGGLHILVGTFGYVRESYKHWRNDA
jgi:hypothetical protein